MGAFVPILGGLRARRQLWSHPKRAQDTEVDYYINKTLLDAEKRYTDLERLLYSLIIYASKLRLYFQAYTTIVPTAHPLRVILHKLETSRRQLNE